VALVLIGGCNGQIFDAGGPSSGRAGPDEPEVADESGVSETDRTLRLSHSEYDNTLHDLLALPEDERFTEGFVEDGGLGALRVLDSRLAGAYQRVAETLSARVTANGAVATAILPCDASEGTACEAQFVHEFGLRAFRRPLTSAEEDAYGALFDLAPDLYADVPPFLAGVRAIVEAMLQSPHFLYRVERGEEESADGTIRLAGYDIANRLSYLLWRSMPDDELFAAAAAGELESDEQIEAQAHRMLAHPRARAMVREFHAQLLELDGYRDLTRDPELSDALGPALMSAMRGEVNLFVDHVFVSGGGLHQLMTSNVSFVNDDLAAIYGLEGTFGDEHERVELDPTERAGILTQVGFLTVNADFANSDPIHRGLFINDRILCTDLPPPPDGTDTTLAPITTTKRAQVEAGTMAPDSVCAGCHATINPPGFALEAYDAVGRFRTTDNGYPVDSSTELLVDGRSVAVGDGVDLAHAIAESDAAARCYARHWVAFAFSRAETPEDTRLIETLGAQLADRSFSIEQLIVELTKTPGFLHRRDER